jgi:hypothetical protein
MPGGGSPYHVSCPRAILDRLRELMQRAVELGIGPQVLDDIRTIQRELETDPLGWGDPQYHLENMGLLTCHRLSTVFYVRYGVDEENGAVYIGEISPRSNHPLSEGS